MTDDNWKQQQRINAINNAAKRRADETREFDNFLLSMLGVLFICLTVLFVYVKWF